MMFDNNRAKQCISHLQNVLLTNGFSLRDISFDGFRDDHLCLEYAEGKWKVYGVDRGEIFNMSTHETIESACYQIISEAADSKEKMRVAKAAFDKAIAPAVTHRPVRTYIPAGGSMPFPMGGRNGVCVARRAMSPAKLQKKRTGYRMVVDAGGAYGKLVASKPTILYRCSVCKKIFTLEHSNIGYITVRVAGNSQNLNLNSDAVCPQCRKKKSQYIQIKLD